MFELTDQQLVDLIHDSLMLSALENAGVDNWEGYGFAFEDKNYDELLEEAELLADKVYERIS